MGHCGASDFPFDVLLCKVPKTYIRPHVATEVNEYGVNVRHSQGHFSNCVMGFDLSSVGVPMDIHAFHETLRNCNPVFIRISDFVGVKVTSGPIKFACWGDFLKVP